MWLKRFVAVEFAGKQRSWFMTTVARRVEWIHGLYHDVECGVLYDACLSQPMRCYLSLARASDTYRPDGYRATIIPSQNLRPPS